METNNPIIPINIKDSHPPVSALREFKASWMPVELNKLWLSIICFLFELSFCITTSFGRETKVIWGLLGLLAGGVIYNLLENTKFSEKLPLVGFFILDAWFLYGLLPWGGATYLLPRYFIAGASPVLTLFFFLAAADNKISGYIYFAQVVCLLYPVKLSIDLEPGEFWMHILFFGMGWNTYLFVTPILFNDVRLENAIMATIPLLRLQGAASLLYTVSLECFLMFQLYATWPMENGRLSFPKSTAFAKVDEETPEVQHHETGSEAEERLLSEEEGGGGGTPIPIALHETTAVVPPKPPTTAASQQQQQQQQQQPPKTRFKVPTLIPTTYTAEKFFKSSTIPQKPKPPSSQLVNINSVTTATALGGEVERLGGNSLKDVYSIGNGGGGGGKS
jgi:hypothetical protein